jgi:leukotriene-A4 hydrolase
MNIRTATGAIAAILLLSGCAVPIAQTGATPRGARVIGTEYPPDPHSYSNPNDAVVQHLDLDLSVNFPEGKLVGVASLVIENRTSASEIVLDARDLRISRVTLDTEMLPTTFTLGTVQELFGQPLSIRIAPGTRRVNIEYETSPGAAALQWLDPRQTAGGRWPFLFTQSQAILARSWIPLQDTPAVRFTYNATIRTPPPLIALMSAINPVEARPDGIYRFEMPQPIPSYLMALAVGEIAFRDLGGNAGVYAEPSIVEKAAWEFADTPKMIEATEALYGPYLWGRYDILVLPPSFPFGGMENPRLTFATPTIIAGDRSLVALIAHELAHSWSGNLVTNATWDDFWLNEGFTSYIENRIMEAVYGDEFARMLQAIGHQDLEREIKDLDPADTSLKVTLGSRDPDEGMTAVAYDKGMLFLKLVEQTVGRERFDPFLRAWFDRNKFQSRTTEEFVAYLDANLLTPSERAAIRVDDWVYGSGVPENVPVAKSARIDRARAQAEEFIWGRKPSELETKEWGTQEWLLFLRALPKLSVGQLADLDRAFAFSTSGNAEIRFAFLRKAVESGYRAAYPSVEDFLSSMGRRKFVQPLFEELMKSEEGKEFAKRLYAKVRPTYHPVTQMTVDKIVGRE